MREELRFGMGGLVITGGGEGVVAGGSGVKLVSSIGGGGGEKVGSEVAITSAGGGLDTLGGMGGAKVGTEFIGGSLAVATVTSKPRPLSGLCIGDSLSYTLSVFGISSVGTMVDICSYNTVSMTGGRQSSILS